MTGITHKDISLWGYTDGTGLAGRGKLPEGQVWCFGSAWCQFCLNKLSDWMGNHEVKDCDCPESLEERPGT